jgi:predicted RNA-binding Zn ribbon-like protein
MLIPAPPEGLCLDFANTRYWRGRESPTEELKAPADLVAWIRRRGGLAETALTAANDAIEAAPERGEALLAEAIKLREAIYRIFNAVAEERAVEDADFATLTTALERAPPRRRLARKDGGYAWDIDIGRIEGAGTAPALLAPVLWSAGDLMLRTTDSRVRRCANDQCLWLFVDDSKSGTRRWCDMSSCGNRAKARRHYARVKGK